MIPFLVAGALAGAVGTIVARAIACRGSRVWGVGIVFQPFCDLLSIGAGNECAGQPKKCASDDETMLGEFRNKKGDVIGCNIIETVPSAYRRENVRVVSYGPRVLLDCDGGCKCGGRCHATSQMS
jgi:hypothetical protein